MRNLSLEEEEDTCEEDTRFGCRCAAIGGLSCMRNVSLEEEEDTYEEDTRFGCRCAAVGCLNIGETEVRVKEHHITNNQEHHITNLNIGEPEYSVKRDLVQS